MTWLVILSLAVARVTRFLIDDTLIANQRDWVLDRMPAKVEELLTCPWCLSVWVAAAACAVAWRSEAMMIRTTVGWVLFTVAVMMASLGFYYLIALLALVGDYVTDRLR